MAENSHSLPAISEANEPQTIHEHGAQIVAEPDSILPERSAATVNGAQTFEPGPSSHHHHHHQIHASDPGPSKVSSPPQSDGQKTPQTRPHRQGSSKSQKMKRSRPSTTSHKSHHSNHPRRNSYFDPAATDEELEAQARDGRPGMVQYGSMYHYSTQRELETWTEDKAWNTRMLVVAIMGVFVVMVILGLGSQGTGR